MTDIKPDTSLYTDLPSRLRAMALVLEGPRERRQHTSNGLPWSDAMSALSSDEDRARTVFSGKNDYRLKPAPPARLHVDITDDGKVAHAHRDEMSPPPQMPGTTRVTYVLENPDAND